jgi:hypothetical protein
MVLIKVKGYLVILVVETGARLRERPLRYWTPFSLPDIDGPSCAHIATHVAMSSALRGAASI